MAQLNLAGIITRVVTDLKARFAAISHAHAAGDITSGTLAIARGGTNAGTAAAARTNLDAAQDASSGTTLYAAQQAISGLAAAQGSVPSGKTLQGEIQTLQDSVARKSTAGNTAEAMIYCDPQLLNRVSTRVKDSNGNTYLLIATDSYIQLYNATTSSVVWRITP